MVPFAKSAANGVGPGLPVELAGLELEEALNGLEVSPAALLPLGDAAEDDEDDEDEAEEEEDALASALAVAGAAGSGLLALALAVSLTARPYGNVSVAPLNGPST